MTAREVLYNQDCSGYVQGEVFGESFYEVEDIVKAMEEYAKIKCEELLNIVAEEIIKVPVKEGYYIDKNSILNAVDLNKFL